MVNLKFQVSTGLLIIYIYGNLLKKNYLSLQQGKALINEIKTKKNWTQFLQTPICNRQFQPDSSYIFSKITFLIQTLVNMDNGNFSVSWVKKLPFIVNLTLRTLFIYTLSMTEYLTTKNLTETAKSFVTSCLMFSPPG